MQPAITIEDLRTGRFVPARVRIVWGRDWLYGPDVYRVGICWGLPPVMAEVREGDRLYAHELSIVLRWSIRLRRF